MRISTDQPLSNVTHGKCSLYVLNLVKYEGDRESVRVNDLD